MLGIVSLLEEKEKKEKKVSSFSTIIRKLGIKRKNL